MGAIRHDITGVDDQRRLLPQRLMREPFTGRPVRASAILYTTWTGM
jgi:hypothetical protein